MLKIFDKKSMIASKNTAAKTWGKSNFIFKHVASDIFEKVTELKDSYRNILIISSDAYEVYEKIKQIKYKNVFFVSEYIDLLNLVKINNINEFKILCNFESLGLRKKKFDLIICNLCLHRINDVRTFIKNLNELSSSEGLLICTYYGGKSLIELRNTLIKTDEIIKKKVYQRVIPFIDMIDATKLFQNAGFQEIVTEKSNIKIEYENLKKLLYDIKNMGENNSLSSRNKGLFSRHFFEKAESIYKKFFISDQKKLIATCEIISLIMWNKKIL